MDLKAHTDSNTVVVSDFIPPITIDRSSKKINKEILGQNHTIDQMSTEYFIQYPLNIHSSQQPVESSPKLIIS
jgi:hypothetical protein